MNYQKHYDLLIEKRQTYIPEGYTENHHIIPDCLGGTNDKENMVLLLPEEHYVAHQLLIKIYSNNSKLIYAAKMMTCNAPNNNRSNNKLYGWVRRKFGESMKNRVFTDDHRKKISLSLSGSIRPDLTGENNGMFGKIGELNHRFGTKHSEETKQKISQSNKENNLVGELNPLYGISRSTEVKNKISETKKKYDYYVTCPHCGKEGKVAGMKTWRFDNCKHKG